jgi:hypothetical protein
MHKNSKLWLIVIRNTEHRLGASHVGDPIASQELLTPQTMDRIRSELPLRLSNGLPLLAEVQIALG